MFIFISIEKQSIAKPFLGEIVVVVVVMVVVAVWEVVVGAKWCSCFAV